MTKSIFCGACLSVALVSGTSVGVGAGEHTAILPQEIPYKAPAPSGAQSAVLYGDPTKAGVYVMYLKIPAGFKAMPHSHSDQWRTSVVLSGTLYYGVGDKWDESKLKAYPAGTFFTEPPGVNHFVWVKDGEVVAEVTGMGPSRVIPVPLK